MEEGSLLGTKKRKLSVVEGGETTPGWDGNDANDKTSNKGSFCDPSNGAKRSFVPPAEDVCSSTNSSLDQVSAASCCSSTLAGAKFLEEERESLEVETSSICRCSFRGEETTPSGEEEGVIEGDEMESRQREEKERSGAPGQRVAERAVRPAGAELEEFFAKAEREYEQEKKRLMEKYNFDFDKEEALEGRYEWVRLGAPMK